MHRRTLLASGAAAITYSVAGCLGSDGGGGDPLEFEAWLADPGIFARDDYPSPFQYFDVGRLVDEEDDLADLLERNQFVETDPVLYHAGLELQDVDLRIASPELYSVVEGDFEAGDIEDEIGGDDRFTEESSEGDWVQYRVEGLLGEVAALGVTDGTAVRVGNTDAQSEEDFIVAPANWDSVEALGGVIGSNDDESSRYPSQNEHIATLVDELGTGDAGFGVRKRADETSIPNSEFGGQEAWGAEFDVDGGTTAFTEVYVFAEGEDPPEADIEEWLSRDSPHLWGSNAQTSDHEIAIEENVAVITGEFDTSNGFEIL